MKGCISFACWEPILFLWMLETGWDGSWSLMGFLTSGRFITVFPWKAIWRAKAPRWVSFFVWCVAWNKILTGDNLRLRRLVFVDWCTMCRHCCETIDHLLLHCEMAYQLWSFIFKTFGLSWVIPRSILDLLFGWWNWMGKHSSQIWNLVPLCILWCI